MFINKIIPPYLPRFYHIYIKNVQKLLFLIKKKKRYIYVHLIGSLQNLGEIYIIDTYNKLIDKIWVFKKQHHQEESLETFLSQFKNRKFSFQINIKL